MKNFKIITIAILLTTVIGCNQKVTNKLVDDRLKNLLEKKNYFKLKDELTKSESELSEDRILYYNAFINNAFGEEEKSINNIDVLLKKYKQTLTDTAITEILGAQAANYLYLYQYQKAANIYNEILVNYSKIIDSAEIANYKNAQSLFGAFGKVKPQLIHKHSLVEIASFRNKYNHLMTPVKSNNDTTDFIFDTGANISTISESQAKKMGLKIIDQDINVGTISSAVVQSKLAVADSFYVGSILFENVIFLVMPDNQLTFPQINYKINGIIGFPVIHQMGEVHLHKSGKITIPENPQNEVTQNVFFDGLNPVVRVFSNSDTLLFTFDTGAKNTELSAKYYKEHKNDVEKFGKLRSTERGGAGGTSKEETYELPNFKVNIGSKSITIDTVSVVLDKNSLSKEFDGNMGQDVFTKFNTLIINFKNMYIDFN